MKKIFTIIFVLFAFVNATVAQTTTATQTITLTIVNSIGITFSGSGTSTGTAVTIPFATVSDYANGITSAAQAMVVQSNTRFAVTVKANAANFTYTGSVTPAPTMPVSGVLAIIVPANGTGGSIVSPFSTSTYSTLTSTAQNLLTACTNGASQTFSVQYKATPGFTYPGGTYTTSVIYTATQY